MTDLNNCYLAFYTNKRKIEKIYKVCYGIANYRNTIFLHTFKNAVILKRNQCTNVEYM